MSSNAQGPPDNVVEMRLSSVKSGPPSNAVDGDRGTQAKPREDSKAHRKRSHKLPKGCKLVSVDKTAKPMVKKGFPTKNAQNAPSVSRGLDPTPKSSNVSEISEKGEGSQEGQDDGDLDLIVGFSDHEDQLSGWDQDDVNDQSLDGGDNGQGPLVKLTVDNNDIQDQTDEDLGAEGDDDEHWDSESIDESEDEQPPCKRRAIEGRFDPLASSVSRSWELNASQNQFISEYFTEWLKDEVVKKSVLKTNPVPDNDSLTVPNLDDEILELLPQASKVSCSHFDGSMKRVQNKLIDTMGPLGKLWQNLDKVSQEGGGSLNVNKLLSLVEQSVLVLGQANVLINYNRRTNILARFFKDNKVAAKLVRSNATVLKKNKTLLFGRAFHKALYRRAKGRKAMRQVKSEVTQNSTFRGPGVKQPFRRGSQPAAGGGAFKIQGGSNAAYQRNFQGQRNGRGRPNFNRSKFQGQQKKSGYVYLYVSEQSISKPQRFSHKSCSYSKCFRNRSGTNSPTTDGARVLSNKCPQQQNRRQNRVVCRKLEMSYKRPQSVRSNIRPQARINNTTTSTSRSFPSKILKEGRTDLVRGSETNDCQRSSRSGERRKKSIHRAPVPSPQTGRIISPCVQPQTSEQVCEIREVQDGRDADVDPLDSKQRLHVQDRHERCIFLHPNSETGPDIVEVPVGTQNLRIQGPSIRPCIGSKDIYEGHQTSDWVLPKNWHSTHYISGRYHNTESVSSEINERHKLSNLVAPEPRVCDQLEQVNDKANTTTRISRVCCGYTENDFLTSYGESGQNQRSLQTSLTNRDSLSSNLVRNYRATNINSFGCPSSSSPLQEITDAQVKSIASGESELRDSNNVELTVQGRTPLVDLLPGSVEWQSNYYPRPRYSDYDRCVKNRLGCRLSGDNHSGTMEYGREGTTHQCVGIDGSDVCPESLYQERPKYPCSFSGRQSTHISADKQDGGSQIRETSLGDRTDVELLPAEQDHNYCRTYPWYKKHSGRPPISELHRQQQLEISCGDPEGSREVVRHDNSRPICGQTECPKTTICQLETRPRSNGGRCFCDIMDDEGSICLPPVQPHREMSGKSPKRQGHASIGDTHMADPAMVSDDSTDEYSDSDFIARSTRSLTGPSGTLSPVNHSKTAATSGVESLRQRFTSKGISTNAANLLLRSRRQGTQTAYNGPWQKWASWCCAKQVDPFQASVEHVVNFLTEQVDRGIAYSTLNCYRSAISAYHEEIAGQKVGQHPLVRQLLKGMFNKNPPKPKYTEVWDVNKVLLHIKSLGTNETLDLRLLTEKLAMLMALASASRCSELHKLNPKSVTDRGDQLIFHIEGLTKSKSQTRPFIDLVFQEYKVDKLLDVVNCYRCFIQRTETMRILENQQSTVFIATVAPHKPVQPCTIARWLRNVMDKAGIDTAMFKAHSTRAASASKAKVLGVSTQQILDRANWSKESTFLKFYNKSVMCDEQNKFQSTVLTLPKL